MQSVKVVTPQITTCKADLVLLIGLLQLVTAACIMLSWANSE